jgi:hypothetical protein
MTTRNEFLSFIHANRPRSSYSKEIANWLSGETISFQKLFSFGDSLFYGYPKGFSIKIGIFSEGQLTIPLISRDQLRGITQSSRKTIRELQSILSSKQGNLPSQP